MGRVRGQAVLPAVVALMAIILFAEMAVYVVQLQSLRAQAALEEERIIAVRQLQTIFKIVGYEWLPVDEYRARLRIVLQNVGRFGAKVVYLAVALEDDSRWPPLWLWAQEWKAPGALGDIPQELRVEAREWSSDNYPVVKPGGYITIETTEPINLPLLYTIVWSGVIHPGDVYSVTCGASGKCRLVKVEDGLLYWWPLDASTYDIMRGEKLETSGGAVEWRLGYGGVDGSWLYTWLTRDHPTAAVSAMVNCTSSGGCVASLWASAWLWSGFEVLVDGRRVDYSPFTTGLVHELVPVPEGIHNLTIVYRLGGVMTSFQAGLDQLWVAKSNTVTIYGVEPGWRVILRYYDPVSKQWREESVTAYTGTATLRWPLDTKPETKAVIIIRRT